MSTLTFEPPGPGVWELDRAHTQRPLTRFMAEVLSAEMPRGFAEGTARYGSLLDRLELAVVNGFCYMSPRPVGAPPGAKGPPPKLVFQLLTRLHPELRRRIKASDRAFAARLWREDLAEWDERVKPAMIAGHLALQAEDPARMDDAGLADHLGRCREHVARMVHQHHRYNLAALLPVGDFLAHATEWTGLSPGEVCATLRGATPISVGAEAELDRLVAALATAPGLRERVMGGDEPGLVVAALRAAEGEAGGAARDWLARIEYRPLAGYDIADPTTGEVPEVLLGRLRAAIAPAPAGERETSEAAVARVRDRVPAGEREAFDALLAEARSIYRLRDERGMLSDMWANGIMRRVALVAGERLVARGVLPRPELMCEASADEMRALVRGEPGPSAAELEAREAYRLNATTDMAPPFLGGTPGSPPPAEWLPTPASRRLARAMNVAIAGLFKAEGGKTGERTVKGAPVGQGVYEGRARLVLGPSDFTRLEQGDVLVARTTTAAFNVVLPLLGGIVTDQGGVLCHTAIVAREYGIPAVIGTVEGTRLIPDGARVRVDGEKGEVHLL